jgi:hypothetical protein
VVLLDLSKIQLRSAFSIDHCVSRNKVHLFAHTVDNVHDCVIAMQLWELYDIVDTDYIP